MPNNADTAATLAAEAATDFAGGMSYGDYLQLDTLLAAQHPCSDEHDEMLFVIVHQASELWMKALLHELGAAREKIRRDELEPAFKGLARVGRIQAQMILSWDVLATMTPADYSSFRNTLGQSSGFQSAQYRLIEFMLGNKNPHMIKPHRHVRALAARLQAELETPSLYDESIRLLARRGLPVDAAVLARDVTQPHHANASVQAAWLTVYRAPETHWDLYQLAEELVDIEDAFQQWRFRHLRTVQRIMGFKRGTGGTAGATYLSKAMEIVFFPDLWELRTLV
jgi:tryptophan 2,3-dioxygenase